MIGFYVTVQRNPGTPAMRTGLLLGPYSTKAGAEAEVSRGRALAEAADPWTAFDAFGVSRLERDGDLPRGVLNDYEPPPPLVVAYTHQEGSA